MRAADKVPKEAKTFAFYLDARKGGTGCLWVDDVDLWQTPAK